MIAAAPILALLALLGAPLFAVIAASAPERRGMAHRRSR